jgi:hypothetical protein
VNILLYICLTLVDELDARCICMNLMDDDFLWIMVICLAFSTNF